VLFWLLFETPTKCRALRALLLVTLLLMYFYLTFTPMQKASVGRYEWHTGSEQSLCVHTRIWLTYWTGRLFYSEFLLLVSGTVFLYSSLVRVICLYNTAIMLLRDIKSGHALVEGKTNIFGKWICEQQSLWRALSSVIDCHRPVNISTPSSVSKSKEETSMKQATNTANRVMENLGLFRLGGNL
jgi:hypothetical protein